ncbi:Oidioi.mRNA.OKI2018_I69.XSR.g15520.t1.cds [Oikopleura dioica]|uniref:Oidioi.mRNA.OKI2018_I69.XSR.g15520.t1.cds n=1 Tax=Oikopleura dioica TaxID=34765 RepID=A0ABN7SD50_OIKDI|nr:Oidioi.mRNA.OKI2018_I69.XSR.g15520.t1.cds [Oikopleura dioica]
MEQKDENNQSKDVVKYRASLQSCRNWNSQLAKNRRSRIPYFDSQTNVDQVEIEERTAGLRELSDNISEAYRYPQRRWRRRKDPTSSRALAENPEHGVTCLPNWKIFEDTPELNDAHMQDDEGDSDEDFKFKGRRSAGGRKLPPSRRSSVRSTRLSNDNQRSRLKPSIDDDYEAYEPQHECHICGHRVLHQSSLGYHMRKAHPEAIAKQSTSTDQRRLFNNVLNYGKCDVCSNGPEASSEDMSMLVQCGGPCKRLGHPFCMNLPSNIVKNITSYLWECQDCKHCSKCGLDENDDKLLFCDDCDRGVHLYCLNPPLKKPPSGQWTCGICA